MQSSTDQEWKEARDRAERPTLEANSLAPDSTDVVFSLVPVLISMVRNDGPKGTVVHAQGYCCEVYKSAHVCYEEFVRWVQSRAHDH